MSDDNWLQAVRKKWSKQDGESSDFLHYLTDHQGIPLTDLLIRIF